RGGWGVGATGGWGPSAGRGGVGRWGDGPPDFPLFSRPPPLGGEG
ncbi:single-stranded DNA-binding protein, partial [Azospirillum brasilense]